MLQARSSHSLVVYAGGAIPTLHVIGGQGTEGAELTSVEMHVTDDDEWILHDDMKLDMPRKFGCGLSL